MINLDFSNMPIGMTPVLDENQIDFSEWREADLMFKELSKKYYDKFPNTAPVNNIIFGMSSPDCVKLDERIKEISYDIEQLMKTTPTITNTLDIVKSSNPNVLKLYVLRKILLRDKRIFNNYTCTDTLEKKKIEDNAKMLTKESAKTEKKVLEKGYKEQYLYIGFGAVILLVGLYIVTRNKK